MLGLGFGLGLGLGFGLGGRVMEANRGLEAGEARLDLSDELGLALAIA